MRKLRTWWSFPTLCAGSMEIACCIPKQKQICSPVSTPLYQAWLCRRYYLNSSVCHLLSQESQIKRIFGTMINQKLQDFEEDVKALGDLMTQVIDFAHNYTGLALSYLSLQKIGKLLRLFTFLCFFLGNH